MWLGAVRVTTTPAWRLRRFVDARPYSADLQSMNRFKILVFAIALTVCASLPAVGQAPTTILLVRHAEKAGEPTDRDPELSEAGRQRAAELARVLGDANITAIYSTPFIRTEKTAAPLAEKLGLEVTITPITRTFVQDLAATLRSQHAGETVLVVGHSNTVPQTITALGVPLDNLEEREYDWLFVVTLVDGHASLTKLRFGQ